MKMTQFLEDPDGKSSATRLAFLLWAIGVLVVWVVTSVTSTPMQLAKIDNSVITLLAILMTGKVVQMFPEQQFRRNANPERRAEQPSTSPPPG